jgi:phytoene dehydrogenase-like protein
VRYDAAIIGASADGLAAAVTLARKGFKTVVIERGDRPGGLMSTREFHPGFHASPYTDELPPIPTSIHWDFDLSRRGAVFVRAPNSLAVWPDRQHLFSARALSPAQSLLGEAAIMRTDAIAYAGKSARQPRPGKFSFQRPPPREAWPGDNWSMQSLQQTLESRLDDADSRAHLAALAVEGRTADPFLRGSALQLLAPGGGGSGVVMGGLGRLADALTHAASEAGVEIRCGLDASDLRLNQGGIAGIALVDGSEFEARAVISTLDLKRSILSLFSWQALPKDVVARAGNFRMGSGTARVLFALGSPPALPSPELLRGPIHVAPDFSRFAEADLACRGGTIARELPMTLRVVSATDPGLAPAGRAVVTATLGAVPFRLYDGAWTKEKRDILYRHALDAAELVFPGIGDQVIAAEIITPTDIDESLGATNGDIWGGEIAPDQMFDERPWASSPRTPIRGLYLAGPSSPLGPLATCAAGILAAEAVMTDIKPAPRK